MLKNIKHFFNSIFNKAYWQYVLFSRSGMMSILSIFGSIYLLIEALDFFNIYTRDKYASYAFFIIFLVSIIISILMKRPIKSITIDSPQYDFTIEVKIANLFDVSGAIMISTNSDLEADVSGGKIAVDSLQGQFTAKYYTGNQNELIRNIDNFINKSGIKAPFPMGTVVPIRTHGKTFYFTVMSDLNNEGNAYTTSDNIKTALNGLWNYIKESGELQEIVLPVIGTGRGRLQISRKKMISIIAESFVKSSLSNKFTNKLVIVIRPEDASSFGVNLYDIKDSLKHSLFT